MTSIIKQTADVKRKGELEQIKKYQIIYIIRSIGKFTTLATTTTTEVPHVGGTQSCLVGCQLYCNFQITKYTDVHNYHFALLSHFNVTSGTFEVLIDHLRSIAVDIHVVNRQRISTYTHTVNVFK